MFFKHRRLDSARVVIPRPPSENPMFYFACIRFGGVFVTSVTARFGKVVVSIVIVSFAGETKCEFNLRSIVVWR